MKLNFAEANKKKATFLVKATQNFYQYISAPWIDE